ncbi:MAG: hypothetical protein PUA49_03075 [Butyrivibrio sp.]|nr:hypothetical protein [Butyrivibrio sp.]
MKKIRSQNNGGKSRVIGIVGTGHGVGTTHFCLTLAVFFACVRGSAVSLIDLSENNCIRQAGNVLANFSRELKSFNKIKIFRQCNISELAEIISSNYDIVIIDFGSNIDQRKAQFLMCSTKLVVGSLSWWKIHEVVNFYAKMSCEKSVGNWKFYAGFRTESGMKYLKKSFGMDVHQIPFVPDPFSLSSEIMDDLWEISENL